MYIMQEGRTSLQYIPLLVCSNVKVNCTCDVLRHRHWLWYGCYFLPQLRLSDIYLQSILQTPDYSSTGKLMRWWIFPLVYGSCDHVRVTECQQLRKTVLVGHKFLRIYASSPGRLCLALQTSYLRVNKQRLILGGRISLDWQDHNGDVRRYHAWIFRLIDTQPGWLGLPLSIIPVSQRQCRAEDFWASI